MSNEQRVLGLVGAGGAASGVCLFLVAVPALNQCTAVQEVLLMLLGLT